MNIDELTLGQLKQIQALLGGGPTPQDDSHWEIGKPYFIRTVTHHFTGILIKVTPAEFVLVDAAWIADDGRFNIAVKTGVFDEVEPFPDGQEVFVGRGGFIDGTQIPAVPRQVKPSK